MAQGNVPISLLLDSNGKEQMDEDQPAPTNQEVSTLTQSLVSQYQTSVDATAVSSPAPSSPLPMESSAKAAPRAIAPARRGRPPTNPHSGQLLDQLKSFQTNFRAGAKKAAPKLAAKVPKSTRASITSIINTDDNPGDTSVPAPPEKKRRGPKTDGTSKKAKTESAKKPTKAELKAAEAKATADQKKTNAKKKTPELTPNLLEKPGVHATMTVEKRKWAQASPSVGDPTILEAGEGNLRLMGRDDDDQDKRDSVLPVIVLDIPLLDPKDPKPGQAEVVVHVMKMAEEKYGWNAMHPNSKSAIDLLDEMLEDEDDGEEDEEEEPAAIDDKAAVGKKKDEPTKEKKKKKEPKVNRKVGKYDCDDPFIDDTELQWEEEITTTKEGFFVYWGPLVDDRATGPTRKNAAKNKK